MSLSPLPSPSPADPPRSADLAALDAAVATVIDVDVQPLSAVERKDRLTRLRAAIDALEVCFDTTVAAADTAGDGQLLDGATSTTGWLRHTLRMAPREAASHVRTARMLGHSTSAGHCPAAPAAAAVLSGAISYPHLQTITGTLADLADHPHLPAEARTQAVQLMVDLAHQVDPTSLRAAAKHLRYVLDPDRGKTDHDRQTQARRASLAPLLDGTWRLEMLTTPDGGALLSALLNATAAPVSADDPRTPTQRRHDALIDALTAATQTGQLPVTNGLSPTILITTPPNAYLPHNSTTDQPPPSDKPPSDKPPSDKALSDKALSDKALSGQWRPARFADGTPIPGPLFDQLTCNPTLTRILQEPGGKVLDVGRTHRFFTPAQRTALWARDAGCRFPGCTAPWTHAHHITAWQAGGTTNLANGVLLCSHHHRATHDGTWTITCGPNGANGAITFTHYNRLTTHHSPLPPPDPLQRE